MTFEIRLYFREELRVVLYKEMVKGRIFNKLDLCHEFVLVKQTRVSFGVDKHNSKMVLDYVHLDA